VGTRRLASTGKRAGRGLTLPGMIVWVEGSGPEHRSVVFQFPDELSMSSMGQAMAKWQQWWSGLSRVIGRRAGPVSLGPRGEQLAARFLQQQGYRIIARGHRQRLGEIDLIALDGDTLVFVEVKTRQSQRAGDPSEAVDLRKQERVTRAALAYLKRRRLLEQAARFDVVSIVWAAPDEPPDIRHFVNAFQAVGQWQMYR
jgi:putative endonuclease